LIAWEKWPLGWRSFLETICCLLMGDPGRIMNSEWRFHFAGGREQLFAIRYSLFAIRFVLTPPLRAAGADRTCRKARGAATAGRARPAWRRTRSTRRPRHGRRASRGRDPD